MAALLHFEEKVHTRRLTRAAALHLLFPRLLCHVLAHMGFPADPHSEPRRHCRESFSLDQWNQVWLHQHSPELPEPREVPPTPSTLASSEPVPEAVSSDAPLAVPSTSEPPIIIPGAEYRALLASFQTLTTTQTAIMERMDHFQLRQDQQTLILSKQRREAKRSKEKLRENEEKQRTTAAVFLFTFGALPEVYFLHDIYHFKAHEVKNATLQTVYNLELNEEDMAFSRQLLQACANSHNTFRLCETRTTLAQHLQDSGCYKQPRVVDDMNNYRSHELRPLDAMKSSKASRCYEQLRVINDMNNLRSYELRHLVAMNNIGLRMI
ncbi:hypothetical protein CK203_106972 [Vitis vinifera]|uniref:Uncharacterized protein n=1 Tax=Vitis vinifera TaxID=29760 RepID=A0A438BPM1_VITVI|nr:hypothetical protein CK203_106972 [Vitis vinifera]